MLVNGGKSKALQYKNLNRIGLAEFNFNKQINAGATIGIQAHTHIQIDFYEYELEFFF